MPRRIILMLAHTNCKMGIATLTAVAMLIVSLSQIACGAPPEKIPSDAKPFAGWKVENVDAWTQKSRLYLEIQKWPEDGKLRIPRMANSVVGIDLKDVPSQIIELQPEPKWWILKLGNKPEDGQNLLVIEFDSKPLLFSEKIIAEPGRNKIIFLPAKYAITVGEKLRFEPQANKNTVGYWSNPNDTAEWLFKLEEPGMYEVEILQGCGKGNGGSMVDIIIENQLLKLEVQDTGHFQNFIWKPVGTIKLAETKAGKLKVIPDTKASGAVMDVRAIRLCPVGAERSMAPQLVEPDAVPKPF